MMPEFVLTIVINCLILYCSGIDYEYYSGEKNKYDSSTDGLLTNNETEPGIDNGKNTVEYDNFLIFKINNDTPKLNVTRKNNIIRDGKETVFYTTHVKTSPTTTECPDNYGYCDENDDSKQNTTTEILSTSSTKAHFYYINFNNVSPMVPVVRKYTSLPSNDRSWYVPEDRLCWNMPTIYGTFSARDSRHVFLVDNPEMEDIVLKTSSKFNKSMIDTNYNRHPLTMQDMRAQWCSVKPCLSEHVLCMYKPSRLSKVCMKHYKVESPSFLQTINIIDTLNSMRNRVAHGRALRYHHLPTSSNMKQVSYNMDLQKISEVWLNQCLPGPPLCSSLKNGNKIVQLECTKYGDRCCLGSIEDTAQCIPQGECHVDSYIGCLYLWFSKAGKSLTERDINCGVVEPETYHSAQILYADTDKVGCALGENSHGTQRIICNFSPGPAFEIRTEFYCGFVQNTHQIMEVQTNETEDDITKSTYLSKFNINLQNYNYTYQQYYNALINKTRSYPIPLNPQSNRQRKIISFRDIDSLSYPTKNRHWILRILAKLYKEYAYRKETKDFYYTQSAMSHLVTKYNFKSTIETVCDLKSPIYKAGPPASECEIKGGRYKSLCNEYIDRSEDYRFAAVLAPLAFFTLILYDLFNNSVRQTIY